VVVDGHHQSALGFRLLLTACKLVKSKHFSGLSPVWNGLWRRVSRSSAALAQRSVYGCRWRVPPASAGLNGKVSVDNDNMLNTHKSGRHSGEGVGNGVVWAGNEPSGELFEASRTTDAAGGRIHNTPKQSSQVSNGPRGALYESRRL
jgi:hypothetical protein